MDQDCIKICPKCGEEYSQEAITCAECGAALVFPQQYDSPAEPPDQGEPVVLIRQGTASYLRELAELLHKKGIRTDVRFHGCEPGT
jgi:hypothetical protein